MVPLALQAVLMLTASRRLVCYGLQNNPKVPSAALSVIDCKQSKGPFCRLVCCWLQTVQRWGADSLTAEALILPTSLFQASVVMIFPLTRTSGKRFSKPRTLSAKFRNLSIIVGRRYIYVLLNAKSGEWRLISRRRRLGKADCYRFEENVWYKSIRDERSEIWTSQNDEDFEHKLTLFKV